MPIKAFDIRAVYVFRFSVEVLPYANVISITTAAVRFAIL